MKDEDLEMLANQILETEKNRINNSDWPDLTYEELSLIDDVEKRQQYRKQMRKFHLQIINPLANSVPRKFTFSVPNDQLTYRIMMNDYMQYFYKKKKTREEIIQMIIDNKIITSKRKK